VKRVSAFLRWLPYNLGYRHGPLLMSRLRRWWVMARHPHANIRIHPTCYLGPGFSLHVTGPGTFEAGRYTQFRRGFRAEIEGAVRAGGGELLEGLGVFDLYRGEQLGEGNKSLALRLEFRAPDRTLTDEEVAGLRGSIESELERIGGALRA